MSSPSNNSSAIPSPTNNATRFSQKRNPPDHDVVQIDPRPPSTLPHHPYRLATQTSQRIDEAIAERIRAMSNAELLAFIRNPPSITDTTTPAPSPTPTLPPAPIHLTVTAMSQKDYWLSVITSVVAQTVSHLAHTPPSILRELRCVSPRVVPPAAKRRRVNKVQGMDTEERAVHPLDITYPGRLVGTHIPNFVKRKVDRRSCKLCYAFTGKERKTWVYCECCGIHLCFGVGGKDGGRHCYKTFHTCTNLVELATRVAGESW